MDEVVPRFEFRIFAPSVERMEDRVRGLAECERVDESREVYLLSREESAWSRNLKIRDGVLDLKILMERKNALERWKPVGKERLPLSRHFVKGPLGPDLGVELLDASRSEFSLEELVREVINTHLRLAAAWVEKRRMRFRIDGCPVEIDEVRINGATVFSAAAESEDPEALEALVGKLGLAEEENVCYPRAIRRVMGIEPAPGQPWFQNE